MIGLHCDKLQSSEEANELVSETFANNYETLAEIEENLIGEWGTIGVIPGWTAFETAAECIHLAVSEDSITLTDENTGISTTSSYEIILTENEVNDFFWFNLIVEEEMAGTRTGMTTFSEEHMFGSGGWIDADTYIYEKL